MEASASIVSVGNELLYGQTVDTNAAWLGRFLAARGIRVGRRYTVGDVESGIREAVAGACAGADLVVVTGGLGPTRDDLTKQSVAAHLGRALIVDEGARRDVEAHFRRAGLDQVPALSVGQYEVPEGARVLHNPKGTAPGLLLEEGSVHIVLLPGVPSEMRAIVEGDLATFLTAWATGRAVSPVHHRVVHTTGIFETKLAEALEARLDELTREARAGIDIAYLPDILGVDLRLTIRGGEAAAADHRFDALLEAVTDVLAPWSFEADSGDLAEAVVRELRTAGRSLAVAESCTGGLVGKRVTDIAGSSDVFLGGVISYADEVKVRELGVSPDDLDRHGAVSEPVALQMARGAAERFGADAAIGITGVAGPGGGTEDKPVGSVWIAVVLDGQAEAFLTRFSGDRAAVRARAAQAALAGLHRRLVVAFQDTS